MRLILHSLKSCLNFYPTSTRQTIHAIEKGKYNPSLELSLCIAKYFETSIENIFYLEE
ncbi:transcriptional regulator, partial [Listeria monocytogenes]|nr:transcriptional regulator [Listeria monocytogenes]ECX5860441.1 helix-turn-helix transcriptional regulator [Listeria monocytogenes]